MLKHMSTREINAYFKRTLKDLKGANAEFVEIVASGLLDDLDGCKADHEKVFPIDDLPELPHPWKRG
jgi:hypothetical protein